MLSYVFPPANKHGVHISWLCSGTQVHWTKETGSEAASEKMGKTETMTGPDDKTKLAEVRS